MPESVRGQQIDWKNTSSKPVVFSSVSPKEDDGLKSDMLRLSIRDLFAFQLQSAAHGIKGSVFDPKGYIKVTAYLYSDTLENSNGPVFYQCKVTSSTNGQFVHTGLEYELGQYLAWYQSDTTTFRIRSKWNSTDYKTSVISALHENFENHFAGTVPNSFTFFPNGTGTDNVIPVVIQVEVFKAQALEIIVPGVGKILPGFFRPPYLKMQTTANPSIVNDRLNFGFDIFKPSINQADYPDGYKITFSDIKITYSAVMDKTPGTPCLTISAEDIMNHSTPYSINTADLLHGPVSALSVNDYGIFAEYDITVSFIENGKRIDYNFPNRKQFIDNFRRLATKDLLVYDIGKENYFDLPVYLLSGGMSAEYAVQKSLATLAGGISHTWNVRERNGVPDLADGGPISVYPSEHFLDMSVKKTVELYDQEFGSATPFETVVIGTGVANVPYLTSAMKAPFLPLHFLVSSNSVNDVARVVNGATSDGYSVFSTFGYDPSIPGIGVAWIKLRTLPEAYKDFLVSHQVKNVIIVGYFDESIEGENHASRILSAGSQQNEKLADGSIYMMMTNGAKEYTSRIADYNLHRYDQETLIPDWEGGVADLQVENFSNAISALAQPPKVFTIRSLGSGTMYRWAVNMSLQYFKKLSTQPSTSVLNEYLVGFPEWEFKNAQVPFLYWQGLHEDQNALYFDEYTSFLTTQAFPTVDLKTKTLLINNKADRQSLITALGKIGYSAVQYPWKKADVWLLDQAEDPPSVRIAKQIVAAGVTKFKDWNRNRPAFSISDLEVMQTHSVKPPPPSYTSHPSPSATNVVKQIADAGLTIKKYDFDPNTFWQPRNFPNQIAFHRFTGTNGELVGYLDGEQKPADIRRQSITIAEFNTSNTSDEYDLKVAYKFNINKNEGLTSYDPARGEEQNMDCFEFTSIPRNHWLDIPSRVMAREGATLILNGSVYDFDYNGIPGVVPFIKKDGAIKAQPQILSYKGEAAFAWNWGSNKTFSIIPRAILEDSSLLQNSVKTLFINETSAYQNALAGMTYMSGHVPYDYTRLQPGWMKNWPKLPYVYMVEGQRCYYAPLSQGCLGTEVVAPIEEGWNDCNNLTISKHVAKFSTVAYRQYPRIFDDVPNARTFIAIGPNKVDIGIIDGDYGMSGRRGRIPTKRYGMHNFELSLFYQYKNYDKLVNLDGGSSTQFWLNGRGPLQLKNGYVLRRDNQGPYYSRLVSSFVMLVPKKHLELIKPSITPNHQYLEIDNSSINFNYNDSTDHSKDKSFLCLTPSMTKLTNSSNKNGLIAGNYRVENSTEAEGAVLFYMGEDAYYPDTQGLADVKPVLRNIVVAGVGKMQQTLIDSLKLIKEVFGKSYAECMNQLNHNDQSFYYIRVRDRVIVDYFFEKAGSKKYIDNKWHSFMIDQPVASYRFLLDNVDVGVLQSSIQYIPDLSYSFLDLTETTHIMVGSMNIDGRFMPGNAKLNFDNLLIALGPDAAAMSSQLRQNISHDLYNYHSLYDPGNLYTKDNVMALTFEENLGSHSFAAQASNPTASKFYGLNINCSRRLYQNPAEGVRIKQADSLQIPMTPKESVALDIYPNPATSDITFLLKTNVNEDDPQPLHYTVVSLSGLVLTEGIVPDFNGSEVEVRNLKQKGFKPGVYFLKIKLRNQLFVRRFVIF